MVSISGCIELCDHAARMHAAPAGWNAVAEAAAAIAQDRNELEGNATSAYGVHGGSSPELFLIWADSAIEEGL